MKNVVTIKNYFDWLPEFDLELKKVGDPSPPTSEKEAKLNDAKIGNSIRKKLEHKQGKETNLI